MAESEKQLRHVGFILDGNRRWAKERGKSASYGHQKGYENMKTILEAAHEMGIEYVSLYVFSTENWKRSKDEVDAILGLIRRFVSSELEELKRRQVKVLWLGSEENVPDDIVKLIRNAENETKDFDNNRVLGLCFNYGGKQEIVDATQAVIDAGEDMSEEAITRHLYGPEMPPIDLLVRTSGERRISNFMLWRMDYAELYFSDTYWPDFAQDELRAIIDDYHGRSRRFGA